MLAQISLGKGEHLKHLLIIRLDVRDEKDVVRVCVSMLILLFNCQTPLFLSRPVATNIMSKNSHRLQTHETVILFLCYDGCRGSGQGRHDQSDYQILTQGKKNATARDIL